MENMEWLAIFPLDSNSELEDSAQREIQSMPSVVRVKKD
jgi:hypothetical protein